MRCYNCNKLGHYARNCKAPKYVSPSKRSHMNNIEEAATNEQYGHSDYEEAATGMSKN